MTNSIAEISGASTIFAIGTNTTQAHPVLALQAKKAAREGAKHVPRDLVQTGSSNQFALDEWVHRADREHGIDRSPGFSEDPPVGIGENIGGRVIGRTSNHHTVEVVQMRDRLVQ